jgi:hypothetical protein
VCMHDGRLDYPQFKNQGACVSFVANNQPCG